MLTLDRFDTCGHQVPSASAHINRKMYRHVDLGITVSPGILRPKLKLLQLSGLRTIASYVTPMGQCVPFATRTALQVSMQLIRLLQQKFLQ